MEDVQHFFSGIPLEPVPALSFFALTVLTLIISMIIASQLSGGMDFGPIQHVAPKAAGLLLAVNVVNFLTCGILLAGLVWLFGLMILFQLEYREARMLARINWGMNLLWKLLLFLTFS